MVSSSLSKMERDQKLFSGDLLAKWYHMNGLWDKPKAETYVGIPWEHAGRRKYGSGVVSTQGEEISCYYWPGSRTVF